MTMPLIFACGILLNHERHLGLRNSLSETQRIFTTSWWTGDSDTIAARKNSRRPNVQQASFDRNAPLEVSLASDELGRAQRGNLALRKRWVPASFMRFVWFCAALFIAMMAYVLGEAYAEIYLRTLPHNTLQTIVYVYTWVATVHILDGLTGWILGGNEGERVGSYPLGWIFKLFVANFLTVSHADIPQLLLVDISNLCSRSIRSTPITSSIYPAPGHLFLGIHHPQPDTNLCALPLGTICTHHQRPVFTDVPEILCSQYLPQIACRVCFYDCIPSLHPSTALRTKQGSIPILHIRHSLSKRHNIRSRRLSQYPKHARTSRWECRDIRFQPHILRFHGHFRMRDCSCVDSEEDLVVWVEYQCHW